MRWIALTLVGLLALAYALIHLSAPDYRVRPAPDETGAGGLSLLTSALRSAGYSVAFDDSARPRLGKRDIAIVPVVQEKEIPDAVLDHVRAGGSAFVIGVPKELQPVKSAIPVTDVVRRKATIDNTQPAPANPTEPSQALPPVTAWRYDEEVVASLAQIGKGRLARLDHGALATNRFLGRMENARVVLSTLDSVADPGDRLIYLAGGYGESVSQGPLEAIGPWAVGALWQSFFLLGAFGIVRGIRFGLPAADRSFHKGTRELLDTIADHYRRGVRTDAALRVALRERPNDPDAQSIASLPNVSEDHARRALIELERRPKPRR